MSGIFDLGGERLTNVGEPTNDDHATTKAYVDEQVQQGGGAISLATTTLTHAQILALPTTAVELIADPGANRTLIPIHAWLHTHWVADYTNIDETSTLTLQQGAGTSHVLAQVNSSSANSLVSDLLAGGGPDGTWAFSATEMIKPTGAKNFAQTGYYDSDLAGALNIKATNGEVGDFQDGDAGNTLTIGVLYQTVSF